MSNDRRKSSARSRSIFEQQSGRASIIPLKRGRGEKRDTLSFGYPMQPQQEFLEDMKSFSNTPRENVEKAIRAMGSNQSKFIIHAIFYKGKTIEELAAILQMKPPVVRRSYQEALIELKRILLVQQSR